MFENRVIPCLQLLDGNLVKTVKFKKYTYIGDPLNTCRIFNELEVDEMVILGIRATVSGEKPNFELLEKLTSECFMPLSYGGGICEFSDAKRLFKAGYEKVVINSALYRNIALAKEITDVYGTQSLIASIDVKKNLLGKYELYSHSGTKRELVDLEQWLEQLQDVGVGEVLLTNISNEGTWSGFDISLIKKVSSLINVPLIVHGGAGSREDVEEAVNNGGASAVGLGSMVVFQKKDMGVLINYDHEYNFKTGGSLR